MKLIELRKEKKLTQKDVANYLQIARTTYSAYEQGANTPDITTLKKLADYYETSIDYLCDFNPPYQFTLPPLTVRQKEAIQILLKLPLEGFFYIYAKLEDLKETYKIT